jgi:hypothetical protein
MRSEAQTFSSRVVLELGFKVLDPSRSSVCGGARIKREISLAVGVHGAKGTVGVPRLSCKGCRAREKEWIHMPDNIKVYMQRTRSRSPDRAFVMTNHESRDKYSDFDPSSSWSSPNKSVRPRDRHTYRSSAYVLG